MWNPELGRGTLTLRELREEPHLPPAGANRELAILRFLMID